MTIKQIELKKMCGLEVDIDKIKEIQIDMLNELVKYCNENNITYYLAGGTLLGAVRHRDFIPWDDDIDVNIPRPDCEKLYNISNGKIGKYIFANTGYVEDLPCESYRLYNLEYIIESSIGNTSKKKLYMPVFIDVFPIEGLPNSINETKNHYKKLKFNRVMINSMVGSIWHGSSIKAKVVHLVCRPFAKTLGFNFWNNRIQKIVTTYSFDNSEYIGVMTAPVHTVKERMNKVDYITPVAVSFEGNEYNAPINYDLYLSQLYGNDYMKIPPPFKRKSHHGFILFKSILL